MYKSPLRDGGYDVADYEEIHPDYGTIEDVREFIEAAHQRGLRVIADFVMNHTSSDHPWFQARARPPLLLLLLRRPPALRLSVISPDLGSTTRTCRVATSNGCVSGLSWAPRLPSKTTERSTHKKKKKKKNIANCWDAQA